MPLHVYLDFTAPFAVGDTVCTSYPPGEHLHAGGPASYDCLQATVLSVKLMVDLDHENSWLINEPLTEKELTVETVIYTVVPSPQFHLSPFTVECNTQKGSHPMLFTSEEGLHTYHHNASAG